MLASSLRGKRAGGQTTRNTLAIISTTANVIPGKYLACYIIIVTLYVFENLLFGNVRAVLCFGLRLLFTEVTEKQISD